MCGSFENRKVGGANSILNFVHYFWALFRKNSNDFIEQVAIAIDVLERCVAVKNVCPWHICNCRRFSSGICFCVSQPLDSCKEVRCANRLGQVIVCAGSQTLLPVSLHGVRGEG